MVQIAKPSEKQREALAFCPEHPVPPEDPIFERLGDPVVTHS
jgi:hypothetical protein